MKIFESHKQNTKLRFFFLRFAAWSFLLQLVVWFGNLLPFVANYIQHSIVVFAGNIYHLFSDKWLAEGNVLMHTDTDRFVVVDEQCTGLTLTATLLAALFSLPKSFLFKIISALLIIAFIQLENSFRIAHLFFQVGQENSSFVFYHIYFWQAVNLLTALTIVFFIYSRIDLPRD